MPTSSRLRTGFILVIFSTKYASLDITRNVSLMPVVHIFVELGLEDDSLSSTVVTLLEESGLWLEADAPTSRFSINWNSISHSRSEEDVSPVSNAILGLSEILSFVVFSSPLDSSFNLFRRQLGYVRLSLLLVALVLPWLSSILGCPTFIHQVLNRWILTFTILNVI